MSGERVLTAALALVLAAGCAMSTPASAQTSSAGDMFGADMNLAPSKPDAVLRYADHPRGIAELRLPKGKGPFPLAVIFHGGCWKTGTANQAYMSPLATRWQQLGIASLNVDYREVGDGGGWPGSFEDWAAAARLIDEVAAKYPIDRTRVTLVGHSAGALPALWLAEPPGPDGPVRQREATRAHAAIVFDGPADVGLEQPAFDALCEFSSVAPFMGGLPADQAARFAAIAPAKHAPALKQVLFANAVLPAPPAAAQTAIRAGGASVKVVENPGVSHFEILTPGTATYRELEPALLKVLRGR